MVSGSLLVDRSDAVDFFSGHDNFSGMPRRCELDLVVHSASRIGSNLDLEVRAVEYIHAVHLRRYVVPIAAGIFSQMCLPFFLQ